jgi:hypothetical protein
MPRIPFIWSSEALFIASLISWTLTSLSVIRVNSVIEPLITGTLTLDPDNFPSKCGKILTKAFAAPVLVGIIELVAALALRKSLWGAS